MFEEKGWIFESNTILNNFCECLIDIETTLDATFRTIRRQLTFDDKEETRHLLNTHFFLLKFFQIVSFFPASLFPSFCSTNKQNLQ